MTQTRRSWREAVLSGDAATGYEIRLDGKPVRLGAGVGGGLELRLPNRALGAAVRDEWQRAGGAQGGSFGAEAIGLTRLAATMQHRVAPARMAMVESLVAWGRDDLLRYRATEPKLAAAQGQAWDAILDWFAARFGLRLQVVAGVLPLVQGPEEPALWQTIVAARSDAELTALATAVPALGSLVLALALIEGEVDAARAVALSRVDERTQALVWGTDPGSPATEAALGAELGEAAEFLRLARIAD